MRLPTSPTLSGSPSKGEGGGGVSPSPAAADVVATPDVDASPLVLGAVDVSDTPKQEDEAGGQEEVPAEGAFAAAAAAVEEREQSTALPRADGLGEAAVDGGVSVGGGGGWGDICENEYGCLFLWLAFFGVSAACFGLSLVRGLRVRTRACVDRLSVLLELLKPLLCSLGSVTHLFAVHRLSPK